MRVVPIENIVSVLNQFGGSAKLSRDIIYLSARGMRIRFAGKGIEISHKQVERLNNLGIDYVFLQDPLCGEELELVVDEDTRVALRAMLEDLIARCGVVLDLFLEEKGKNAKLDYTFRDYWQRYSNLPFNTLQKYRKILQDLTYVVRAHYTQRKVSPLPNVYTDSNFRINHGINVAIISGIIALHYGEFNSDRMFYLISGALLTDVGFVDTAWSLSSPRGEEFFFRHPRVGCMVINETDVFGPRMGIIALEHHRYLNNSGYPDDIPEKDFYGYPRQMHLYSKIVSVAETFESLRWIYNPIKVLMAMKKFIGTLFDEKALNLLERYVSPYYVGERVILASGEVGLVLSVRMAGEMRVLVVEDIKGNRYSIGKEVVIKELDKEIKGVAVDSDDSDLKQKILRLIPDDLLRELGDEKE